MRDDQVKQIFRQVLRERRRLLRQLARIDRQIAAVEGDVAESHVRGFGKPWSRAEIAYVRKHFAGTNHRAIAQHLRRTHCSVKTFCQRIGLIGRRRWTQPEIKVVREAVAANMPREQIVELLPGRSLSSVDQLRAKLGVQRPVKELVKGLDAFIREMHAQQWTDVEIAAEWSKRSLVAAHGGLSRSIISARRRKLGLPSNVCADRQRQKVAAKTREQLEKAGVESLAALKRQIVKKRIRDMGWPEDLQIREAQILSLIWDRGPLTKREICAALNLPFRGARNTLGGNLPGGTYMATLMRRGLLISFRRAVRTGRRGGNVDLYSLALNIQRRKVEPHVGQQQRERPASGQADAPGGGGIGGERPHAAAALADGAARRDERLDPGRRSETDHAGPGEQGQGGRHEGGQLRARPGPQADADGPEARERDPEQLLQQFRGSAAGHARKQCA